MREHEAGASVMKKIAILGATGSIGTQTLDVVRRLPDRLKVVGLSAYRNQALLAEQGREFRIRPENLTTDEADLVRIATLPDVDIVVMAVAGAAGTRATLAALNAGKDVALATKEVLVAAGELVVEAARCGGSRITPIDSEHSAIFQCLANSPVRHVAKLWLTASGGPFREWTAERMNLASVADALAHPTWPNMGRKLTVDSATLMNKALETIEARWLFDIAIEKIAVIIHPQSVVHSLVEFVDGSLLAQMGLPDMRLPIQYALLCPERVDSGLPPLNLPQMSTPLTFHPPDEERFHSLALARRAADEGGTMPAVLNAANEAAVSLFLDGRILFGQITPTIEFVMDSHQKVPQPNLDRIMQADTWARGAAQAYAEDGAALARGASR